MHRSASCPHARAKVWGRSAAPGVCIAWRSSVAGVASRLPGSTRSRVARARGANLRDLLCLLGERLTRTLAEQGSRSRIRARSTTLTCSHRTSTLD
jgi:hypothetical protein